MAKEIKYGAEARKALEAGVNQLSKYSSCNIRTKRKKCSIDQNLTVHHSSQMMV